MNYSAFNLRLFRFSSLVSYCFSAEQSCWQMYYTNEIKNDRTVLFLFSQNREQKKTPCFKAVCSVYTNNIWYLCHVYTIFELKLSSLGLEVKKRKKEIKKSGCVYVWFLFWFFSVGDVCFLVRRQINFVCACLGPENTKRAHHRIIIEKEIGTTNINGIYWVFRAHATHTTSKKILVSVVIQRRSKYWVRAPRNWNVFVKCLFKIKTRKFSALCTCS